MTSYYQRDVASRTGVVFKGRKIRCDGTITVRGKERPCGQILSEVANPDVPAGRNKVDCRRCGKSHLI